MKPKRPRDQREPKANPTPLPRRSLPSRKYWQKRSTERLLAAEQKAERMLPLFHRFYDDARLEVVKMAKELYAHYYDAQKLTFNKQKLNSIAPSRDIHEFVKALRVFGLDTELPDAYRVRLSRLELMHAQLWLESARVGFEHTLHQTRLHDAQIHQAYTAATRDLYQDPNMMVQLDTRTINNILQTKFHGKNYSERIWGNTDLLAQQLQERFAATIATGQGASRMLLELQERFGVAKSYATRLIRTETNFFHNLADLQAYEDAGVEEFEFVATLDARTSQVCQDHDGKRYKLKDAKQGVNVPPLHPNCRSTTIAYLGKDWEPKERAAYDEEDQTRLFIPNMNYKEWRRHYSNASFPLVHTEQPVENSAKRKPDTPEVKRFKREIAKIDLTKATPESIIELGNKFNQQFKIAKKVGNKEKLAEIFGQFRELGGDISGWRFLRKDPTVIKGLRNAFQYYPKEWAERVRRNGTAVDTVKSDRGAFGAKLWDENTKRYGKYLFKDSGKEGTAFHEIGHMIQSLNPEVGRIEHEWLEKRTKGEKVHRLSGLFSDARYGKEITRPDNFISPYIGKIYKPNETGVAYTEVLTVGLQTLFAPESRGVLYRRTMDMKIYRKITDDPEFLNLIIGLFLTI